MVVKGLFLISFAGTQAAIATHAYKCIPYLAALELARFRIRNKAHAYLSPISHEIAVARGLDVESRGSEVRVFRKRRSQTLDVEGNVQQMELLDGPKRWLRFPDLYALIATDRGLELWKDPHTKPERVSRLKFADNASGALHGMSVTRKSLQDVIVDDFAGRREESRPMPLFGAAQRDILLVNEKGIMGIRINPQNQLVLAHKQALTYVPGDDVVFYEGRWRGPIAAAPSAFLIRRNKVGGFLYRNRFHEYGLVNEYEQDTELASSSINEARLIRGNGSTDYLLVRGDNYLAPLVIQDSSSRDIEPYLAVNTEKIVDGKIERVVHMKNENRLIIYYKDPSGADLTDSVALPF